MLLLCVTGYSQLSPVYGNGYDNGWELNNGGEEYYVVEMFHDTMSVDFNVDSMCVEGLRDDRTKLVRPTNVLFADEFGYIYKCPVDSLLSYELQNMQMQIQELYAIIQADYALERTVFFDMQGNEIDPATAKCEGEYVAHVYLESGKCIKRKYSHVE